MRWDALQVTTITAPSRHTVNEKCYKTIELGTGDCEIKTLLCLHFIVIVRTIKF